MDTNKSRIISRVLWVLGAIFLIIILCYLFYSCGQLNSDDVNREYFGDKNYLSADDEYYLSFSDDIKTFDLYTPDANYYNISITDYYDNMIFFDIEDDEYIIAVIDKSTLFLSNARVYLYLM